MKKVILSATCLIFLGVGIFSCKKEEIKNSQNGEISLLSSENIDSEEFNNKARLRMHPNWLVDHSASTGFYGCVEIEGDCLDAVNASPNKIGNLRQIGLEIAAAQKSQKKFIVEENEISLGEIISSNHIKLIKNSKYDIEYKNINDEILFYIIKNPSGQTMGVYQVR
jgi:hypothetical protein